MKMTIDSKVLTLAVLLGATATGFNTMAQDFGGDDVFNSDQIDIDGVYQKRESAADRIEKMRKNLERKNEEMVQKKIEDIRINQEKKLANQLQDAFNGNGGSLGSGNTDQVSTMQAAPQRVVAPEPMPLPMVEEKEEKKTRIIPGFGVSQFNGEGIDSLESDPVLNLAVESLVSERFAVGLGVNFTKMDITYYRDYNNGLSSFYSTYLQGDDVSYKNLNINLNGKLFLTTDATFRPFIGLGLGYNRTTLAFEERYKDVVYNSTSGQLKETSVTGTGATGMGMIGAEFGFNDSIGMTADFRFTKALTNGFSDGNKSYSPNTQEALEKASLKRLGYDLDNSDIASLNVGLLIKF
jgi:hypothetical protein